MKPASIKLFDRLFFASVALGLLGLALSWTTIASTAGAALEQAGLAAEGGAVKWVLIGGALFGIAIDLALWFLISVKRIEIAKWVLVALVAWTVIGIPGSLESVGGFRPDYILGLLSTALLIAAIVFLFRPDAKAWFGQGKGGQAE